MSNKYLEKVADSLGMKVVKMTADKATSPYTQNRGGQNRGVKTLRMGPHTTPDDLLPNPQKMEIRIK